MGTERPRRWLWSAATVIMAGVVLTLALILSQPQEHQPVVVQGAHPLAPAIVALPTLPPTP